MANENRPVYGYDDCFPSVEACEISGTKWRVPDHGEVCWLKWKSEIAENKLTFFTDSKFLPIKFVREMIFTDTSITWRFEVVNEKQEKNPVSACNASADEAGRYQAYNFPDFVQCLINQLSKN